MKLLVEVPLRVLEVLRTPTKQNKAKQNKNGMDLSSVPPDMAPTLLCFKETLVFLEVVLRAHREVHSYDPVEMSGDFARVHETMKDV